MRSASLITTEEHCNPLSYYYESKLTIHFKRLDSLSALCTRTKELIILRTAKIFVNVLLM